MAWPAPCCASRRACKASPWAALAGLQVPPAERLRGLAHGLVGRAERPGNRAEERVAGAPPPPPAAGAGPPGRRRRRPLGRCAPGGLGPGPPARSRPRASSRRSGRAASCCRAGEVAQRLHQRRRLRPWPPASPAGVKAVAQAVQHRLQLVEQLPGAVAGAGARHLADHVDEVAKFVGTQHGVGRDGRRNGPAPPRQLLRPWR